MSFSLSAWRRSSPSNGNGGNNCVELAMTSDGIVVRDSKHPDGPRLRLPGKALGQLKNEATA